MLRRLDVLCFILAAINIATLAAALALHSSAANAFEKAVEESAVWSSHRHHMDDLARLAQAIQDTDQRLLQANAAPSVRAERDVAVLTFLDQQQGLVTSLETRSPSESEQQLQRVLEQARTSLEAAIARSNALIGNGLTVAPARADRAIVEAELASDRTDAYAALYVALEAARQIMESEHAARLEQRLGHAHSLRQLELSAALAVFIIVCLFTVYAWHAGRTLNASQRQRVQMLNELEVARQRLERYADDVSHELRGPLNKIGVELEVLLARPRDASEYREGLELMHGECRRMAGIVDTLLFLARAGANQRLATLQPLILEQELARIADFFAAAAEDAGISLHCTATTPKVMADRGLFQRAVSNLVSNALAHTPRGGEIRLLAHAGGDTVIIEVSDTGSGMTEEARGRATDRFYRGEGSKGMGLGLSITKAIMDVHGGSLGLLPKDGGGTRARLAFPASLASVARKNYGAEI